jgi:hypothetical protein
MNISTKKIFIASLLIGLAGNFIFFNESGFLFHFFPIASMLIYAGLIKFMPIKERDVSDADNAYYMGFIYTMTGLAITLYKSESHESDKMISMLIHSFGLALSTTILGIFLRIIISPERPDLGGEEISTRNNLNDSVQSFIKTIDDSTIKIRDAYDSNTSVLARILDNSSQILESNFSRFNSTFDQSMFNLNALFETRLPHSILKAEESVTSLSSWVVETQSRFQKLVELHSAAITQTNTEIAAKNLRLSESLDKSAATLDGFSKQIQEIRVDQHFIKAHLDSVLLIYQQSANRASNVFIASSKALEEVVSKMTAFPEQLEEYFQTNIAERKEVISSLEKTIEVNSQIHRRLVQINQTIDESNIFITKGFKGLSETIIPVERTASEIHSTSIRNFTDFNQTLSQHFESLNGNIQNLINQNQEVVNILQYGYQNSTQQNRSIDSLN